MILTCPACTVRYVVAEGAIGPNGRKVRCANCGHVWVQEAETGLDDVLFEGDNIVFPHERNAMPPDVERPAQPAESISEFEAILRQQSAAMPIPEGVRPLQEEHDPVAAQLGPRPVAKAVSKGLSRAQLTGMAAAAGIYLLILALFLAFHAPISRAWPASNLLYGFFGLTSVPAGDGLALDDLGADVKDGRIVLSGKIINLRSKDAAVPSVLARFKDSGGKTMAEYLIPAPVAQIKGEATVPFEAAYDNADVAAAAKGAADVDFSFSSEKAPAASEPDVPQNPAPSGIAHE